MASRYYFIQVLLFTLLMALTLAGCFLAADRNPGPVVRITGGLLVLTEALLFIRRMNVMNRKIASILEALQNQDTGIRLPPRSDRGMSGELLQAFRDVIDSFRDLKLEYAAREQLFLAMIEHSSTGFISIDENGDFEIMNQAARSLLGTEYTSNMDRLRDDIPELYQLLVSLKAGETGTCTLKGRGKSSLVRVAPARMKFFGKDFTLVSLQDIRREVDALELESWQKLIRILNHEIMNSIAPITSASRSLKSLFTDADGPVSPGRVDEEMIGDTLDGLDIIESMSAGLKHFVENYRRLSRIPDPVTVSLDPGQWASGLRMMGKELAESTGATLEVSVEEGCPPFRADEGLLNQVLLNLMKNAIQAPGPPDVARRVEISISGLPEGRTSIRVKNNGDPILPGDLDKIFIPFFTTREEGAGIGLFLSRQVVAMHHGSLDVVTSVPGETVFQIQL